MKKYPIEAHGGELKTLCVGPEQRDEIRDESISLPSWDLTPRQLCDIELLLTGAFSPLEGFLCQDEYERVVEEMRLSDGTLWPIPIQLDVPETIATALGPGDGLALRDPEGVMLAVLRVESVWKPDRKREAQMVYGSERREHPGVDFLLNGTHEWYVGGRLEGLELPRHYDFRELRYTPEELRLRFAAMGWRRVVAFQTRNPMHRAHQELTFRAVKEHDANLLIHPVVGLTKPGDVDHYTRVRCYKAILKYYPHNTAMLALLPLSMRMAGPKEALWHAIIRKNFGCTHFILGRDHAGPGADSAGKPFYGPYEAQELLKQHASEIGIEMVPFRNMVYLPEEDRYIPEDEVPAGAPVRSLSGTELRERLASGARVPSWFSFPEVIAELRKTYPPRSRQGFTVFFTGLPSAGKSTIANVLLVKLLEMGDRPVTLLDGDIVRKHLSSELGFSKEHRDLNILRIGFVASEITKNRGIAICAPIAPYDDIRKRVRDMIKPRGGFILVYVATPLAVCETRDRKGLYAKARAGLIRQFTGISDPYEAPGDADVVIDTTNMRPEECAQEVLLELERQGYVGGLG